MRCETAESAARELVERQGALVYGYLVRCGVREESRDALFIDVLKRLWDARALLQTSEGLDPWLLAIVVHGTRMGHREQQVRAWVFGEPSPVSGQPTGQVEVSHCAGRMQDALLALSFEQREVFVLCCIERVALADAAFALDLPVATALLHLQEARLALARSLVRPCGAAKERAG